MEEGEPEVHTTALTAFSAADRPDNSNSNNVIMEDELTTPSTKKELDSVNDQQQRQPPRPLSPRQVGANPAPFFKVVSGSAVAPPALLPRQPAPFFPSVPVTMPSAAASSVDGGGVVATSSPSFSSTYSLFPPSSSTSSLDFTAAWVASTPFSAAATPLPTSVSPPIVGSGFYEQRAPHFLAPKVAIMAPSLHSSAASSMSTASMLSSTSFGKPRPTTTSLIRIEQSKQMQHEMLRQKLERLQQQQEQQQQQSSQENGSGDVVMDGPRQTTLNPSHQPPFITPSYGVSNINKSQPGSDTFVAQPPFFVPSVNAGGDHINNNNSGAGNKFKYPLYHRHPAAMTTHHLGKHWKQMGSQTRQYLQPSIPLPPSSRIASAAAKQLRGASLGGPPGSQSPLTPNKSWAQVVASTPPQIKPHPQATSAENPSGDHGQQQSSISKVGATLAPPPAPPPPPPVAPAKPTRSASLRGLSGLGGVATSSNRDFKSLLLRLKTALDKERDKRRPRDGRVGRESNAVEGHASEEVINIDGQPTVVTINGEAAPTVTINGKHRDDCIFWLGWIVRKLRFSEETLALSASLFDAVLTAVSSAATALLGGEAAALSVTPENCQLVALVCLSLSAKFSEEDADVPTTKDLLAVSEIGVYGSTAPAPSGGYRSSDAVSLAAALKMERVLLTVLEWDLNRPTPLRFLEILHTLLMCHQPQLLEDVALGLTPAKHLEKLTWKMQKIVACHQVGSGFPLSYEKIIMSFLG